MFIHSFIHSFIHLFIHTFIHSFIHSSVDFCRKLRRMERPAASADINGCICSRMIKSRNVSADTALVRALRDEFEDKTNRGPCNMWSCLLKGTLSSAFNRFFPIRPSKVKLTDQHVYPEAKRSDYRFIYIILYYVVLYKLIDNCIALLTV